jgi:hypothetical protein
MRLAGVVVLSVLLVGISGCASFGDDPTPDKTSKEEDRPDEESEEGQEETDEGESDTSWVQTIHYDHLTDTNAEETVEVEVPGSVTNVTISAGFLYWPYAPTPGGVCSTSSKLVVKVTTPGGNVLLESIFDETMKVGVEGDRCTVPDSTIKAAPASSGWEVTFRGAGAAVAEVSFAGS